jgi:hypothetical protein
LIRIGDPSNLWLQILQESEIRASIIANFARQLPFDPNRRSDQVVLQILQESMIESLRPGESVRHLRLSDDAMWLRSPSGSPLGLHRFSEENDERMASFGTIWLDHLQEESWQHAERST